MEQRRKRVLVLSNACFADSDSNGRTLAKLFQGFEPEQLAQFFVYGTPNFNVCKNYYQVSDRDALNSLVRLKEQGERVTDSAKKSTLETANGKKAKKTPLTMLLRETAWFLGRWKGKNLQTWIDEVNPDAVFVSLGDNGFLPNLAVRIAKRRSVPLYVYSTENYCFKDFNYLTKRKSLFYAVFYIWINRCYRKMNAYVKKGFFNTPLLKETYEERFGYPCECVFTPSDIDYIENAETKEPPVVSYMGNLGIGRHEALIEFANILADIFPGAKLDVYGKFPCDEVETQIKVCKSISYRGFVSYDDVRRILHESTLLVHAEKDDPFYSKDLKYAFSTKIADSVCSGTPLLIYARTDLAGTDFLVRNQCAFVASSPEELRKVLKEALMDQYRRNQIIRQAKKAREVFFLDGERIKNVIEG